MTTLFVSLELSRASWLLTVLLPGSARMSKYSSPGGNGSALLSLLGRLQAKVSQVAGDGSISTIVVQEAGLDGFWVHRLLEANGIESHVVDPASVAVPRRQRRAKTDAIDGETLLRTLLAWKRVNRVSARWSSRPPPNKKIAGAWPGNAPSCFRKESVT